MLCCQEGSLWHQRFHELRHFKALHGHLPLPSISSGTSSLKQLPEEAPHSQTGQLHEDMVLDELAETLQHQHPHQQHHDGQWHQHQHQPQLHHHQQHDQQQHPQQPHTQQPLQQQQQQASVQGESVSVSWGDVAAWLHEQQQLHVLGQIKDPIRTKALRQLGES